MRYTKQEKQELITKFKASGQSKNKFSKENNIGIATLHRWLEDETATFVRVETRQEIMPVNKSAQFFASIKFTCHMSPLSLVICRL